MIQLLADPTILKQLVEFYYRHDACQTSYMPYDNAYELYKTLFERNRLCINVKNGELRGYCESFRIGFEEFGKIICGINVYQHLNDWNLYNGNIAYVANVTVAPAHRNSEVIKELTKDFFTLNQGADYFVGRAFRKRHQPIKVFDFHESYNKWIKEDSNGGK